MPKIAPDIRILDIQESGTPDNPLVYWGPAVLPDGIWIRGDYVWVIDVEVPEGTYGANIYGSHNRILQMNAHDVWFGVRITEHGTENIISGCYISGCESGIYLDEFASFNTVIGNTVSDCGNGETGDRAGIAIGGSPAKARPGNKVIGNTVKDCGAPGANASIVVFRSVDSVIENNLIHNAKSLGIQLSSNSTGCQVKGNVINSANEYGIEVRTGSNNALVENNIVYDADTGIYVYGDRSHSMENISLIKNRVTASRSADYLIDPGPNNAGMVIS